MHQSSCRTRFFPRPVAFTLVELLVVLAVVAALAAIGVPVYARVTQGSRATACVSNLRQLGVSLQLYVNDHNLTLPTLAGGRTNRSENVPVIDNTLNAYTGDPRVFACPADTAKHLATTSGTSYFWNVAINGQLVTNLTFFNNTNQTQIPILADKEGFHPYIEQRVNLLYADGHAEKNFSFSVNPPASR